MSRDPLLYLEDMATACRRAISYVEGSTFAQYLGDPKTRDAVARNLEILGEAAKNVPPELRAALPAINWREACAFRDVLAHGYFGLDELILWEVVQKRAPGIAEEVERFLRAPKAL
jgi:uncharacterized protein with HEPN domain